MFTDFKDTYNPLRKVKYIFLLIRFVLQPSLCYMLQNTTSSAYGSCSDWSAGWTVWQQIVFSPKLPHWLWGPPTLLLTGFFYQDKAPRAGIGGSLDDISSKL